MRVEELLQAIGSVDDFYIKKAHRKSRWKAVLTVLVTILVLGTAAVLLMPTDYLLMRMETDGMANTAYADPRALEKDSWTSLERTDYADGSVIGTTEIRRRLYGKYKLVRTEEEQDRTIVGAVRGKYHRSDYVDREDRRDSALKAGGERRWLTTGYTTDLIGRIDSFYISAGTAYENPGALLNMVRIEYMSTGVGSGWVVRQSHVLDDGTVTGYRTFSYANQKLCNTKDYDGDGTLLSYTDYVYDGYVRTAAHYLADGIAAGSERTKYDWLDHIKWRETYDEEGALISREVYHYRPWTLFASAEGLLTLFAMLSLALTFGFAVWDERFRLGDRLVWLPTTRESQVLEEKIEALSKTLKTVSEQIKADAADEETLQHLTEEIEKLNDHLEKLETKKNL